MADIDKFTVVYAASLSGNKAKVEPFDPYAGNPGAVETGHSLLAVTMTDSDEDEELTLLRSGYMRGLGASHITGWEPADGTLLWATSNGEVTATRPTTGLQVCVGRYLGSGVVDVFVHLVPSIGDLSFVGRAIPGEHYVFVWSATDGAYVPRQLTSEDIIDFDFSHHFMLMGD